MALTSGFRLTMFFQYQSSKIGGWSESFWNSGAFGAAGMVANCINLIALRENMTAAQPYIASYRVSDVANFRNVINAPTTYVPGTAITVGNDGDILTAKLYFQMRANGNYKTGQWLGGVPDSQISNGGRYVPAGVWPGLANAFFAALQTNGWSICNQDRSVLPKGVTGITNAGVVTIPGNTYAEGDFIRIKNVKGYLAANDIWRVTLPTSSTVTLVGWVPYVTAPVFGGKRAQATLQKPILNAIVGCSIVRASSHKVGRPFAQASGRRRTRRNSAGLVVVGP